MLLGVILGAMAASCLGPSAEDRTPAPQVDPRFEMICIVFRLAKAPEYVGNFHPEYVADIDQQFAPVGRHEAVEMARRLRNRLIRRIAWGAPLEAALVAKDAESWVPRLSLQPLPRGISDVWSSEELRAFLSALGRFSHDSGFPAFFKSHESTYAGFERNFRAGPTWRGGLDGAWYERIFGQTRLYHLILAPLCGSYNYGFGLDGPDGSLEAYTVMGSFEDRVLRFHPFRQLHLKWIAFDARRDRAQERKSYSAIV